ncbi:BnaCnng42910D [Brassica napus]|uniref:BnaCnng42910D protein n=1 Tax=Brassica napus TaxID=3708 RepID=A0A078JF24_BRANA|nr:BnaCnng42910D [Brassica napus]
MKSKKTNKKFDFKVFTETGPKTSLITDDNIDLKNKGSKPTVRVSNVGHALHVWLNGEYHGNGHGSHDEKSPWLLSGPCFCYFLCAKPSNAFPWLSLLLHYTIL